MDIASATQSDIPAICELADQINAIHHQQLPDLFINPSTIKGSNEFWSKQLTSDNSVFLVAKKEDKVVGFITAKLTENTELPFITRNKLCRIGTIVVSEGYKKKGVGREMMKEVEKWASDYGAAEVRLEVMEFNSNAQSFYDTIGYKNSSRIMAKKLPNKENSDGQS